MMQVGEMPIPFPVSWCRLSGKGSLRHGRPLGSPQPACVSSFLRVGSSNIHCSRARRTGAYHPDAGRGAGDGGRRGPGRACRLRRRPLRICKRKWRRRRTALSSRPLLPGILTAQEPGSSALRNCPSGRVQAGGRRGRESVTPDQLMLPACNWSWVSGPYLSTIFAADRLRCTSACFLSLFGCGPAFSITTSPLIISISSFTLEWEKSPMSCLPYRLPKGPLGPEFLWAFGQAMWAPLLASLFSPVKWEQEAPPYLVTETWGWEDAACIFFNPAGTFYQIFLERPLGLSQNLSNPLHCSLFASILSLHHPCICHPPHSRACPTPFPSLILGTRPSPGLVFCSCCSVAVGFAISRAGLESQLSHPLAV